MLNVLVCDDKAQDQGYIKNRMAMAAARTGKKISIETFDTTDQLLFRIADSQRPVDIILLDIHFPESNGITVARKLREEPIAYTGEIIFITISAGYILSAFDVSAFHYIIKKVTDEQKIDEILEHALVRAEQNSREHVLFKGIGEYRNIPVGDIAYFEVTQRIVTVHYGDDERFEFYSSLEKLETAMIPKGFLRIHRSLLVNVKRIQKGSISQVEMDDGRILHVGRKYRKDLQMVLNQKLII